MPVTIPDGLPAAQTLENENIFVMSRQRASAQDIRPLDIVILNLMPTKEATETQLLRLLGNTALQINVTLLRTASYESTHTSKEHLKTFYSTFEDIKHKKFDGLIVTGAPVEKLAFDEVKYWNELTGIFEWADKNVFSTMFICWAAQAALYHYYGVGKHPLDEKLFGVYPHKVLNSKHKLMRGFDDVFYAPHSRHTTIDATDVQNVTDVELLSVSDQAGVYICVSRDGSRVFVTGHSEYDPETLQNEYIRDVKLGLPIAVPENYYPDDDSTKPPRVIWRSHANLLFGNWLNYFVYQETPYDISQLQR